MDYQKLENYEDHLPDTAKDMIAVIGLTDTIKLVRKHGGNMLLIPKIRHCGDAINYLVDAIGEAAAFKLIEHYRGERIYLPKCDHALRKLRNDEFFNAVEAHIIKHKVSQDKAFFALCPQFGITNRTAFYVMNAKKIEKRLESITQARLF